MAEKPIIEIPVVNVSKIVVGIDPAERALISLETDANADLRLLLTPTALAQLEALLARAAKEQAERSPKQ